MSLFGAIATPVSEELPCGPNPDGVPEYENFVAAAEGNLPASYMSFAKAGFDAAGPLAEISALLGRFRDLRLVVLAAKYNILSGDIAGFAEAVEAAAALVAERWPDVHPQAQDGDYSLRGAQLATLNDMPTVVLPLQYAPLIKDRKLGPLAYRSFLLAKKEVPPRAGESVPEPTALSEALANFDDLAALKSVHDGLKRTAAALKRIRGAFVDNVGYEQAPEFDRLAPLVDAIAKVLGEAVREREPAAVEAAEAPAVGEAEAAAAPPTAATWQAPQSVADAAAALKAVETYFAKHEPSSPTLLLVRQAHQMVGKSFVDSMLLLAPAAAEKSSIKIGGDSPFVLTFAQLKALAGQAAQAAADSPPAQSYTVASRSDGQRLMAAVEAYYRKAEPSSPIPLLVERARLFVDKDFPTLLKDLLKPAG